MGATATKALTLGPRIVIFARSFGASKGLKARVPCGDVDRTPERAAMGATQARGYWAKRVQQGDEGVAAFVDAKLAGDVSEEQEDAADEHDIRALVADWAEKSDAAAKRALALAHTTDESAWLTDACSARLLRHLYAQKNALSSDDTARLQWLTESARLTIAFTPDPDSALLEAYVAATGANPNTLLTENAANLMKRHVDNSRRLPRVVAAFGRYPSAMALPKKWWRELAVGLEGLFFANAFDAIFAVVDTLFAKRAHLTFALEDAQYALSYPAVAALQLEGPIDGAGEDPDAFVRHIAPWLSLGPIGEPRFAFNLACRHAQRQERDALLNMVARALELGKNAWEFHDDADFAVYRNDPGFIALVGRREDFDDDDDDDEDEENEENFERHS